MTTDTTTNSRIDQHPPRSLKKLGLSAMALGLAITSLSAFADTANDRGGALGALDTVASQLGLASHTAEAKTFKSTLKPGQTMRRGDVLRSSNGRCKFAFQRDQNIVIYLDGKAIWTQSTTRSGADRLVMQHDGNLVLYDGRKPEWNTRTWRHRGARLVMQNDCNLVLYRGSRAVWNSRTARRLPSKPAPAPKYAPKIKATKGANHGRTATWLSVSGSGFKPTRTYTIVCRDDEDRGGFYQQRVRTDSRGRFRDTTLCYSNASGDHWATIGNTSSNKVRWNRRGTTTPKPAPAPRPAPAPTPPPTTVPAPPTNPNVGSPYEVGSPYAPGTLSLPLNRSVCSLRPFSDHAGIYSLVVGPSVDSIRTSGITCKWDAMTAGDIQGAPAGIVIPQYSVVPLVEACRYLTGEAPFTGSRQIGCLWTKPTVPISNPDGTYG